MNRVAHRDKPQPGSGEVLPRMTACGVCRTDLHIADGGLPALGHALVPGHKIVGVVDAMGANVGHFAVGERVGVPWLGWTCGHCDYGASGRENLCNAARFTGYHIDGGYADYAFADARYCFRIPSPNWDAEAAPLLCAGLIGYRAYAMALAMTANAITIGIYGFGAAAASRRSSPDKRRTPFCHSPRTSNSGQGATRTIRSATLPSSRRLTPRRPWVLTTSTFAFQLFARSAMVSAT